MALRPSPFLEQMDMFQTYANFLKFTETSWFSWQKLEVLETSRAFRKTPEIPQIYVKQILNFSGSSSQKDKTYV